MYIIITFLLLEHSIGNNQEEEGTQFILQNSLKDLNVSYTKYFIYLVT